MEKFWEKVKKAGQAVASWWREKFVPWWNRTVVVWTRDKLVPWWKEKAVPWIKKTAQTVWSTLKNWAAAIPPFLSKVARKVEELLGSAMTKLSERGKSK